MRFENNDPPDIPEQIKELMRDEEIENMQNLDGWAVGTVIEVDEDGTRVATHEDAWIELFNGEGRAGKFGGVRFMAVTDGTYEEAYAYATRDSSVGNEPCFYVKEYDVPSNPRYGAPGPEFGGNV